MSGRPRRAAAVAAKAAITDSTPEAAAAKAAARVGRPRRPTAKTAKPEPADSSSSDFEPPSQHTPKTSQYRRLRSVAGDASRVQTASKPRATKRSGGRDAPASQPPLSKRAVAAGTRARKGQQAVPVVAPPPAEAMDVGTSSDGESCVEDEPVHNSPPRREPRRSTRATNRQTPAAQAPAREKTVRGPTPAGDAKGANGAKDPTGARESAPAPRTRRRQEATPPATPRRGQSKAPRKPDSASRSSGTAKLTPTRASGDGADGDYQPSSSSDSDFETVDPVLSRAVERRLDRQLKKVRGPAGACVPEAPGAFPPRRLRPSQRQMRPASQHPPCFNCPRPASPLAPGLAISCLAAHPPARPA